MSHLLSEIEVLNKLDIPDFRHLSKDKVMSFVSMIQEMDPEVAKKAIEQFPEFVKMAADALMDYKEVIIKAFDANDESNTQCLKMYDDIMDALKACAQMEDISFEQRKYFIDQMVEIAKMAEEKDRENKNAILKKIAAFGGVVVVALGVGLGALGGKFDINLPKPKS